MMQPQDDSQQSPLASDMSSTSLMTLPGEVLSSIISYCPDAESLASLDATCKTLQALTAPHWEARALQRFGFFGRSPGSTGKDLWRFASGLLRPDKVVCVPLAPCNHPEMAMEGTASLGSSGSSSRIMVMGSDCYNSYNDHNPDDGWLFPLVVRTVANDDYSPVILDSEISTSEIAVVGSEQGEIVVNAGCRRDYLHAQRLCPVKGTVNRKMFNMRDVEREQGIDAAGELSGLYMALLGCSELLIAARRSRFFFFVPDEKSLLRLVKVTRIDCNDVSASWAGMGWASPELGKNVFCCRTNPCRVRAWRVDLQSDTSVLLHNVLDFQTADIEDVDVIAVSSSYVAVSRGASKQISIYNHNGTLFSKLSEGVDDERDEDDLVDPVCMFATGEILVSSSIEGAALCIWDMRKGVLLYRITDLFDRSKTPSWSIQDKLPDGCDITSMVPLYEQGAVCFCVSDIQYVCAFPGDWSRHRRLKALVHSEDSREARHRQLGDDNSDDSDERYDSEDVSGDDNEDDSE
jgi:hypothetical protein